MVLDDEILRKQFAARLNQALSGYPPTANPHGRATYVARKLGVTPKAASKWINADAMPRGAKMQALSDMLGVSIGWLRDGTENSLYNIRSDSNIDDAVQEPYKKVKADKLPRLVAQLPVLNSAQAINPALSIAGDDVEGYLGAPHDMNLGKDSFYFRIDDNSMLSAERQMFRPGTLVLIDPTIKAEPGMFVLAKVLIKGELTAVFRAYFEKDTVNGFDTFDLVPLNPAIKTTRVIKPEDGEIIGGLAMISTPATDLRY